MKMILTLLVASVAIISTVSAATGSTSTGSTSTGSTSTGTTLSGTTSTGSTSTGTTSTGVVVSTSSKGAGGPTRGYNMTTKQFDLGPQCFPWAWLLDFYKGNIFMIYENQRSCREQRLIDFGM